MTSPHRAPLCSLGLGSVFALLMSCQAPAPVSLGQTGQLRFALSDPALLDATQSYVAAMYESAELDADCASLLNALPDELESPGLVSAQVFPAQTNGEDNTHAFARIENAGRYSFLLLGTRMAPPFGQDDPRRLRPLSSATQQVIAAGCQEVEVEPGQQIDLDIVLFPVGLR